MLAVVLLAILVFLVVGGICLFIRKREISRRKKEIREKGLHAVRTVSRQVR